MTTHTLKPCPHCGNLHNKHQDDACQFWISCPSCEMVGPDCGTEDGSVAAWNALPRPSEVADLRAEVERLRTNATARERLLTRRTDALRAAERRIDELEAHDE